MTHEILQAMHRCGDRVWHRGGGRSRVKNVIATLLSTAVGVALMIVCIAPARAEGIRITLPAQLVATGPGGVVPGGMATPGTITQNGQVMVGPMPSMGSTTTGTGGTLPPATTPPGNRSGLLLTLDTTWIDVQGYRPVRISIQAVNPTTADRTLRVSLQPGQDYRGGTLAVARDIELPAGFTKIDCTLSVPQFEEWNSFDFDTFENGSQIAELSLADFNNSPSGNRGQSNAPKVLFLGKHNESLVFNGMNNGLSGNSLYVGLDENQNNVTTTIGNGRTTRIYSYALRKSIAADELPTRWIDYQGLDLVIGSLAEVQSLSTKHPRQWQALRLWVASGGNLCIYGFGPKPTPWLKLPDLEKLIDWPQLSEASASGPQPDLAARDWTVPEYDQHDADAHLRSLNTNSLSIDSMQNEMSTATTQPQSRASQRAKVPTLVSRELGHGMIVAAWPEDALDSGTFQWLYVFMHMKHDRMHWSVRNGLSLQQPNNHFWHFLIPDVGSAPVTTFQLLITLFVIVIGPVNYLVLKRWRRLNLLLISIPVSAAVVTGMLLLYAIVADGFDVQVRSRSVTWLDQRHGEAATLGRTTYYAGLAPTDGMRFAGDAAPLPLEAIPTTRGTDTEKPRTIDWEPAAPTDEIGTQHFASGWLKSREQSQMVTTRVRKSKLGIDFSQLPAGTMQATNRLGVPITLLLMSDVVGKLHWAEQIGDTSDTFELSPMDADAADGELNRFRQSLAMLNPDGVAQAPNYSRGIFNIRRSRYHYGYKNLMLSGSLASGNRLEQQLDRALDFARSNNRLPNRYLAIIEYSPELDIGLTDVRERAGFHVILGEW